MQHFPKIDTEQSKRDLRWSSAKSFADCNAYMAIEAQASGARGFAMRGAISGVNAHYRYAREMLGITEADQLFS
jgi:hypothetical protein